MLKSDLAKDGVNQNYVGSESFSFARDKTKQFQPHVTGFLVVYLTDLLLRKTAYGVNPLKVKRHAKKQTTPGTHTLAKTKKGDDFIDFFSS